MRTKTITLLFAIAVIVTSICYSRTTVSAGIFKNDILKIEYINSVNGVVQIGSKKLRVGEEFTASMKIEWNVYGTKSIKARNLRTGEIVRFCSSNFKNYNAENLMEWYIKYHRTFDKGISSQENKMANMLSQIHYMIDDTLFINSTLEQNETNKFYVAKPIRYSGTYKHPFPLEFDDETNQIAITKNYLQEFGVDISQVPVTFSIEYHSGSMVTPLTDNMIIEYIPNVNCRK